MTGAVRLETRPGDGRERIRHYVDVGDEVYCYVHRLAVLAWRDVTPSELQDLEVHHQSGIPWLNIDDDLELQEAEQHGAIEAERRTRDVDGNYSGYNAQRARRPSP